MSTNKIGRNDPCPCGSGKKYKKCCEGMTGSVQPASPLLPSGLDLHPYAIAKIIENPAPHVQASLSRRGSMTCGSGLCERVYGRAVGLSWSVSKGVNYGVAHW